jgi:ABC-type sugar transport system substrate-binding protein
MNQGKLRAARFISVFSIMILASTAVLGTSASAAAIKNFKLCSALGGIPGLTGLLGPTGDPVAKAGAKKRHWKYYEVNNKLDAQTAVKNADLLIQQKCSVVLEFNGEPSVNPVIAAKFKRAKISVITYDIGQAGWYFLGIDNLGAGMAGGAGLAKIAKAKWNCDVDLVLASHAYGAGIVDAMRTGGMIDGFKTVCPNIDPKKIISFEGNGRIEVAAPAARDIFAANPTAKKIAVVGLNDAGVVGVLQAARQVGADMQVIGWGQDGSLITGTKVDPDLKGSVLYFLEGYSAYAFPLLEEIASGKKPTMRDGSTNPAVLVKPCPVSAAEAAKLPDATRRVAALLKAPGKTLYDLFCPSAKKKK